MKCSDLTLDERYLIQNFLLGGLSVAVIARELRRDRSTIYDELARGRARGGYCPHVAQKRRDRARARCGGNARCKSAALWAEIKAHLKQGLTPDEIAGRLALVEQRTLLTFQGIYQHVWRHQWQRWLKSFRRRRHLQRPAQRPWNGQASPIRKRDPDVARRIEAGHFEIDSMLGKRTDRQRVVVAVERQSLYTCLVLVTQLDATSVAKQLQRRLADCGLPVLSVTTDRGWEFTQLSEHLEIPTYVCDPHAPNQRGTNENQIGRLRIDWPKGMSINHLTPAKVARVEHQHNHTPRKALGYLTPYEVAFHCPPPVGVWC
jgi:transposase, IS30 family